MKTTTNLTPSLRPTHPRHCEEERRSNPYTISSLRGTKQSNLSPSGGGAGGGSFFPLMGGLRGAFFLIFLSLCLSCSDSSDPHSSRIFVRVSGECVCNLFLYTSEGFCLQSKIWDCQETTYLTFDVFQEGQFTIKAEYRDKSTSQTITAQLDKTYEIDIIF